MLKSLKSNSYRFVVVLLLLLTFLTVGVGKVIPVSALAQPVTPDLMPIYDTTIVQLGDYVENTLTESQGDIYYVLMGLFLYSQAASSEYELVDPYGSKSDILSWLKSCGIQLHNALIKFIPDNQIITVGGKAYNIGDMKPYLTGIASYALGAATKASTYNTYSNFVDDIDNSEHWFMPYDQSLQIGVNTVLGVGNGLYNWQFDTHAFVSDFQWITPVASGSLLAEYIGYVDDLSTPVVRYNLGSNYSGCKYAGYYYATYHNLFINTYNHTIYQVDDNGVDYINSLRDVRQYVYIRNNEQIYHGLASMSDYTTVSYNPSLYTNYRDLAQDYFDNEFNLDPDTCFSDYINHVYVGTSWNDKVEIFNNTDLNIAESESVYYLQVQNDYLLDIKGIINDLVDTIDLHTVLLDNLFNDDGTLNINPSLIKVSVDLPDITIETQKDPDLPVNLNEIELYTDNEYLDVVKERALQASETIGEYVAFWHNCDSELVYAILGSFIVILIGAFIGKWGHS